MGTGLRIRSDEKDILKIGADLSIVKEIQRQVGRGEPQIPYPTVCKYRQIGKIESFKRASRQIVRRYVDAGTVPPRYKLDYRIEKVELIPSMSNSANCADFVKQENEYAATKGGIPYTWYFKDFASDVIFDPWHARVFTKQ